MLRLFDPDWTNAFYTKPSEINSWNWKTRIMETGEREEQGKADALAYQEVAISSSRDQWNGVRKASGEVEALFCVCEKFLQTQLESDTSQNRELVGVGSDWICRINSNIW